MSENNYIEERRSAKRLEVGWDLAVAGTDHAGSRFKHAGALQNLSSNGAFFYLPKRVKRGATLEVEIRVPMNQKTWMKYSAEVVRVSRVKTTFGIAVSFATARPAFIKR